MKPSDQKRLELVRASARKVRASTTKERNQALHALAKLLHSRENEILHANANDLQRLRSDANAAFRDRLTLNSKRVRAMIDSLKQVASLEDPVGEVIEKRTLKNGLKTARVRAPLGVIFMIFESRPNVAIEAFSLALKSGNALILRAGKESLRTVTLLYRLIQEAMKSAGLPMDAFWGIESPDRELVNELLQARDAIDVVVPRGGEGLIRFVVENSKIPIIKNDRGLCHVYVDSGADLTMAADILVNGKTQRPGVCNAVETLLVHRGIAKKFLPLVVERMPEVEFRASAEAMPLLKGAPSLVKAKPVDFDTEYLDLILNVAVVEDLDGAIAHIERHGSKHSECIVTPSKKNARKFQAEVDAAAVYWNASTRFTDGYALGLGGELGISTQKLHVRGPVGLRELTCVRWIMDGTGQTRRQ